ncbi:MAG: hypothetical protein U0794_18705 [Isosphaeraceae bacterium]
MPPNDRSTDPLETRRIHLGPVRGKHVRLDPAFHSGPETPAESPPTPESGWLFEFLRRAIQARSRDRRGALRHNVVNRDVWVGWWTRDDFGAVAGSLVNLSRGGALVTIPQRPPKRQSIWLYKEVDDALVCARGEMVDHVAAPQGAYNVRLKFAAPCPTILCEAALCRPVDPKRRRSRGEPQAPPFGTRL